MRHFFRYKRRGFGHFIAISLGVAASIAFFGIVFPIAKGMVSNTANNMQSVDNNILGTMCSSTDLSACTTCTQCTGAGGTWDTTTNTCS